MENLIKSSNFVNFKVTASAIPIREETSNPDLSVGNITVTAN